VLAYQTRKPAASGPQIALSETAPIVAPLAVEKLHVDGRDRTIARIVTLLAGLAALVIALAPPITSFISGHDRLDGALETSARLFAAEVSILAQHTPGFWEFDGIHVSAPTDESDTGVPERRRVYNMSGRLVLESVPAKEMAWPVLSHTAVIMKGTTAVGQAEASRSFRRPLVLAFLVGLASAIGALLIFIALRVVPLRLLQQAINRAVYLSSYDVLTGLPNRAVFADKLQQALSQVPRSGARVAVLGLDLDRFKGINDTLGHHAGDIVLRVVAGRMRSCLRVGDTLARLGGDEFAVILPNVELLEDAEILASRLVEAVELAIDINSQPAYVGLSIGIALNEVGVDSAQLLQNADLALYKAKGSGRGQWCFFTQGMNAHLVERRALDIDLRAAVAEHQFFLDYQPQVNLGNGRIIGVEALVRWRRPGHGPISPETFIGPAEEAGLIGAIGAWVLQEACRVAAPWPAAIGIAVNVSAAQFRLPHFHDTVVAALSASGLSPSRLQLEITEGILMRDTDETLVVLGRLRALGIRFAMDDFGTGYSSLGYLQRFRFDKIKIDRSFIRRLASDPSAAAIVRAILALSKAIDLCAIAEGVETTTQADLLRREGCQEAQGYLFGQPMTPDEVTVLLATDGAAHSTKPVGATPS
jgi:diguanylate cyclase (GGDEF)-like protein